MMMIRKPNTVAFESPYFKRNEQPWERFSDQTLQFKPIKMEKVKDEDPPSRKNLKRKFIKSVLRNARLISRMGLSMDELMMIHS